MMKWGYLHWNDLRIGLMRLVFWKNDLNRWLINSTKFECMNLSKALGIS